MTFDLVILLMGWQYDSFDCLLFITKPLVDVIQTLVSLTNSISHPPIPLALRRCQAHTVIYGTSSHKHGLRLYKNLMIF